MGVSTIQGFPIPLPVTVSEQQLERAAQRPLPALGLIAHALLLCAREMLDANQIEQLRRLCADVDDWQKFVQQAGFRLILPLVFRHLSTHASDIVPGPVLADLKALALRSTMRNLSMIAAHQALIRQVLEPAGVRYLFFKGPSLAYHYYRDPGLRQFRDIDLLIERDDMLALGQRLREAGYQPAKHQAWATDDGLQFLQRFVGMMDWISPEGVLVEMPTSLDGDWDRLPNDEVFAQAVPVNLAGVQVRVPDPADFFCYLCKHHGRHHWARLHWIADLNAILAHPDFDLNAARQRAKQRGFSRIVDAALAIHRAIAQPEPWKAEFDDPFAHELFRHCLVNQEGDFEQELALRESFPTTSIDIDLGRRRKRHRYARNRSRFKPRAEDFLHWPMPAKWHFLYYALRPFLYMSRASHQTDQDRIKPND